MTTSVDDIGHVKPAEESKFWGADRDSKPKLKQILKDPNQITFYKKNKVSAIFKLSPWNGDKNQTKLEPGNKGYKCSKTRRRVISAEGISTDPEMYSTSKYRQNLEDAHNAYTMNHSTNEK